MKQEQTALLQGTLDMLILKSLLAGEMHGLESRAESSSSPAALFRSSPARSFLRYTAWRKKAGFLRFGGFRKQPPRQILSIDEGWAEATRSGSPKVGPNFLGYRASFGSLVKEVWHATPSEMPHEGNIRAGMQPKEAQCPWRNPFFCYSCLGSGWENRIHEILL